MKNLYYKVWADAFQVMKKKYPKMTDKELLWDNLSFISIINSINLVTIITVIEILTNYDLTFELDIFHGDYIDKILTYSIQFYLPVFIFNYLVLFRNNNYKSIFKRYKPYDGKIVVPYIFISLFTLVILVIGSIILRNLG